MNQIEDVCTDVEKTINQTIQNTLNQLEKDCDEIGAMVDRTIEEDDKVSFENGSRFPIWQHGFTFRDGKRTVFQQVEKKLKRFFFCRF